MTHPTPITQPTVIHPQTRMGTVHYTVINLARQVAFYRDILGFKVHWQIDNSAGLGAGREDLLQLTQNPNARRYRGTTGLYHTAFLVPTRYEQAQILKQIAETRTPIQGMTNHGTHYAVYLPDAEGNGIEIAWDLPRTAWPKSFDEMFQRNRRLNPDDVFSALEQGPQTWDGLHADTQVGHVHLHVADIPASLRFYRDVLGFELPLGLNPANSHFADQVAFFSAGGYHHHIGANVWQGVGAPQAPADATGLRYFTVVLPNQEALDGLLAQVESAGVAVTAHERGTLIHDPAGNGVLLSAPK